MYDVFWLDIKLSTSSRTSIMFLIYMNQIELILFYKPLLKKLLDRV